MALEMTSYDGTTSTEGDSHSTMVYVCDWDESLGYRNLLLGALDANDLTLKCQTVRRTYLKGDGNCGKAELTCEFIPASKVDESTVDAPLKMRVEIAGEMITVGDGTTSYYKWSETGLDVPAQIFGTKPLTLWKVVLYGTRSSIDLSSYNAYANTVNSDTFKGAAAETIRFVSASINERADAEGVTVYDVEISLEYRPSNWNKAINPDVSGMPWQTPIAKVGGNKQFAAVAYAALLAAA